jgi:hypothetical protein
VLTIKDITRKEYLNRGFASRGGAYHKNGGSRHRGRSSSIRNAFRLKGDNDRANADFTQAAQLDPRSAH